MSNITKSDVVVAKHDVPGMSYKTTLNVYQVAARLSTCQSVGQMKWAIREICEFGEVYCRLPRVQATMLAVCVSTQFDYYFAYDEQYSEWWLTRIMFGTGELIFNHGGESIYVPRLKSVSEYFQITKESFRLKNLDLLKVSKLIDEDDRFDENDWKGCINPVVFNVK